MLEISQMHLCSDCNVYLLVNNAQASVLVSLLNSLNFGYTVFDATRPNTALSSNRGTCFDNIATSIHFDKITSVFVKPTVVSDHAPEFGLFNCVMGK